MSWRVASMARWTPMEVRVAEPVPEAAMVADPGRVLTEGAASTPADVVKEAI